MTRGATYEIAEWLAGLRDHDVPAATREAVRCAVLDTLGCGVYGHTTAWARATREWASRGSAGWASIWSPGGRGLRPADAALANGVAAHAFELDDYHHAKIHPGAAVIPAALALGEQVETSGMALFTAIVAGYEVMIRAALALDPVSARLRGWHLTGVTGPLGAAAAAASLLRLDAERTAWALGLAGTQGAGLFAFNADGSMSKRLHPGRAAHAGTLAAELAQAGFTGPTRLFEAKDGGFLRAFSEAPRIERLTANLGQVFHTDAISFKPYSCCGSVHAYIDAAFELRVRLGGPPHPSVRVRVGVSRVVDVQCGFPYEPSTVMHAQMSLRYCVAVALLDGAVSPPQFAPAKLEDPELVALARRIELVPDPELDRLYPEHFAGWVAVDGAGLATRADVLDPTGSPARPMDFKALGEKFRALVSRILPPEAIRRIEGAVAALEEIPARRLIGGLGSA
jgi:2-methylcitrate dehydratase PrpD